MDSAPVNWESLDSLVIDFAKSENLFEDSIPTTSPSPSPSPTSSTTVAAPTTTEASSSPPPSTFSSSAYQSRLLIRQIRSFMESGDVDGAIEQLGLHAPEVLEDNRILFRLQKQKFVELLRKGTAKDHDAAMRCLRESLAPVALHAYPEAYEEFKHILLALIFNKDDKNSPVANEWSENRRSDIAGLLCSVLRVQLHAYDPIFAMTLRYLISIHKIYCSRQGISSPISDLTQRLLLEDRDIPGIPPQESLYEAPPFDEVDIQALAHAVELTRQNAIDSLRGAKGNLLEAFQNELSGMKIDLTVLDELVHEYCVYRGIVESAYVPSSDRMNNRFSDGEMSISNVIVEDGQMLESGSNQTCDSEFRCSHEIACSSNLEDCSTSDTHQPENLCRRFRRKSQETTWCHTRKRWRGRDIETPYNIIKESRPQSVNFAFGETEGEQISSNSSLEHVDDHKYEIILEMRELVSKGMVMKVVDEINAADPVFFAQNPILLFQFKQVEFLQLVSSGNNSDALKVASTYLGPLASSNPVLLKPLKDTLISLLQPNENLAADDTKLSSLATSLQVSMSGRFGIKEPQLMKIMRVTLHNHNEWFKLQMCKDRFEGLLQIDTLKQIDVLMPSDSRSKLLTDSDALQHPLSSSGQKLPDGTSPSSASSGIIGLDELAILKVMEFLALPRADAIQLLTQFNGDAEEVIQHTFD